MILKRRLGEAEGKLPSETANPIGVTRQGRNRPSIITFADGNQAAGSCIRCPDAPCQRYRESESRNSFFPEFPGDSSTNVCPTDAIEIKSPEGFPIIDESRCISCGICVERCPVQAVFLTDRGAAVNDNENPAFRFTQEPVYASKILEVAVKFKKVPIGGRMVDDGEVFVWQVYQKIRSIGSSLNSQFPSIMTRNIMRSVGVPFHIRRLGDNNIRFDAILLAPSGTIGVAEIKFDDTSVLDTPRNIMEACAVLASRYGIPLGSIEPLIVSQTFPSARSEYWRVISDIAKILGIQVRSVTTGALLLLLWEGRQLAPDLWKSLYLNESNQSLQDALFAGLGRPFRPSDELSAIVRAAK